MSILDGLRAVVVDVIGAAMPARRPVTRGVRKYHYSRIFGNGRLKDRQGAQRLKPAHGPNSYAEESPQQELNRKRRETMLMKEMIL